MTRTPHRLLAFMISLLLAAGLSAAYAAHTGQGTDTGKATVTGNVCVRTGGGVPNLGLDGVCNQPGDPIGGDGIPGVTEACATSSFVFSGVIIHIAALKATNGTSFSGTVAVSGVEGASPCSKETGSNGTINSAANKANIACSNGTVTPPGGAAPFDGSLEGKFYGTFTREDLRVTGGLTLEYQIYAGANCLGAVVATSPVAGVGTANAGGVPAKLTGVLGRMTMDPAGHWKGFSFIGDLKVL